MKGMLSKAFSLALLISVVPSFAMNVQNAAEKVAEEVPAEVALVVNAAQQMADASSAATTAQNAVVSAGITIAAPTVWDRVKHYADVAKYYANNAYQSAANSSAAGYAHAALVAPFNYTVGALANKSGLADRVPGFVKNDSYYSSTIGKYAFGLAAMYAGYRAVKSVYNYATTPADKKAVVAPVVKKAVSKPAQEVVITSKVGQDAVALINAIVADKSKGLRAKYVAQVDGNVALSNFCFNPKDQQVLPLSVALGAQTLSDTIVECLTNLDSGTNAQKAQARTKLFQVQTQVHTLAAAITAEEAKLMANAPKATVASRVYNALVNRYTFLGGATAIGAGTVAYKLYNRAK